VVLPSEPGLYLIRGSNEVDTSLQGNDVGKSTLWDAVHWALYGQTTRGLRAGNVVAWGESTASVELEMEIGGRAVSILRRQAPNEIRIDGSPVTQAAVDDLVGRSEAEFIQSALLGQFSDYFLDLGPADKLSLLSDVLGLDYWVGRSDAAKARAGELGGEADSLRRDLDRLSGRIEVMREQFVSLKERSAAWRHEHTAWREAVCRKVEWLKLRSTLYASLHARSERFAKASHEVLAGSDKLLAEYQAQHRMLTNDLRNLGSRRGLQRCPFCDSDLGEAWDGRIAAEEARVRAELRRIETAIGLEQDANDRLSGLLRAAQRESSGLRESLASITADLLRVKDEQYAVELNPHSEGLHAVSEDLREARAARKRTRAVHGQVLGEQARCLYWVRGFRDLRLWILDASLAELEMQANNGLAQLGLDRWQIRMGVDRETKSGGVSRGFNVRVVPPGTSEDAPWKAWGGGVTQRLRLATQMGLANLINSRKQFVCGFEVWDEPTAHLSPQGVRDLLACLKYRSGATGRAVYVIDHRSLDFGFDGTLHVTKTAEGSTVRTV
jgi:DNA repair exonuclease SbcCD ATPase subunit